MDVKTVCLGMLTNGPASGYDLKKEFESSFSHFFAAGYGSIYPALSALAGEGLVNCEEIPQEGKPDRKVYEITDEGRAFLSEALRKTNPCHKIRSEFLATMCFAHLMRPEDVEAVFDHRLEEIASFRDMAERFECECMHEWPEGARFVLGMGRAVTDAMETFIKENRHKFASQSAAKTASG